MSAIDRMELLDDEGFRRRIEFTVFDVARDKAPGAAPGSSDEAFIDGILNGENQMRLVAVAVIVVNADPATANDASLKATVNAIWPFFASSWMRRVVVP